jgi:hypothetical protein
VFLEAAMEVAQNDVVLLFPDLEWSASRVWGTEIHFDVYQVEMPPQIPTSQNDIADAIDYNRLLRTSRHMRFWQSII